MLHHMHVWVAIVYYYDGVNGYWGDTFYTYY